MPRPKGQPADVRPVAGKHKEGEKRRCKICGMGIIWTPLGWKHMWPTRDKHAAVLGGKFKE